MHFTENIGNFDLFEIKPNIFKFIYFHFIFKRTFIKKFMQVIELINLIRLSVQLTASI